MSELGVTNHVEGVGHQRQRVDGIACDRLIGRSRGDSALHTDDQLEQEESAINRQQNDDTGSFGETHAE